MTIYVFTTVDDPSAFGFSENNGINASGQIVGNYSDHSGGIHGFIDNNGNFGNIDDPSSTATGAHGINLSGQIVGRYHDSTTLVDHAFLFNNKIFTTVNDPDGVRTDTATGINDSGQIVGTYIDSSGHEHGYIDTNGQFRTIDDPLRAPGGFSEAVGINNAGQIVGDYQDSSGKFHGYFYSNGTYTTLDAPGAKSTSPAGINNHGDIVGSYRDLGNTEHGFLYSGGLYTTIDFPTDATETWASGINDAGQIVGGYHKPLGGGFITHGFLLEQMPNPPKPAGTSADMIMVHGDGAYEIYDIGNNAILAAYSLGAVGTDWSVVARGGFNGSDTADMLLRNAGTGGFEVYDIADNQITNAAFLGTVGLNWQAIGFGNFGSLGETDMMLRNSDTGGIEVYDVRNNAITGSNFMGTVGLNWQAVGFGNFSSRGTSDMIMRNSQTGALEVYDIDSNQITGAAPLGALGSEWRASGVGNFSGTLGESDLLMRNIRSGALVGIGAIGGSAASDLVLRDTNTGAFEVYDIANNAITSAAPLGSVGLDWQVGGIAIDPPTGSAGDSTAVGQLVQSMAGFDAGGPAGDSLNAVALGADPSPQPFLSTPQHG